MLDGGCCTVGCNGRRWRTPARTARCNTCIPRSMHRLPKQAVPAAATRTPAPSLPRRASQSQSQLALGARPLATARSHVAQDVSAGATHPTGPSPAKQTHHASMRPGGHAISATARARTRGAARHHAHQTRGPDLAACLSTECAMPQFMEKEKTGSSCAWAGAFERWGEQAPGSVRRP